MRYFLLCSFALVCLPISAWSSCSTEPEHTAIAARVLQTEMMVAALTCHKEQEYNRVTARFSSYFQEQSGVFKQYFERVYLGDAEKNINRFITRVANQASAQSLKVSAAEYCQKTEKLFGALETTNSRALVDIKIPEPLSIAHDIKRCEEKEVFSLSKLFGTR